MFLLGNLAPIPNEQSYIFVKSTSITFCISDSSFQRRLDHPTLFTQIHGKLRRTENITRPYLDLSKHKCPLVQGNETDLSVSRPVIPFQDPINPV